MASSTITVNGANASLPVQLEPGVANRLDVTVDAALRLDANKTNALTRKELGRLAPRPLVSNAVTASQHSANSSKETLDN